MEKFQTLMDIIKRRRSIRKFESISVPRDKIIACIEAAMFAPSAENIQPWRFHILDDPGQKSAFCEEVFSGIYRPTRWAMQAPVIIALIADVNMLAHKIGGGIQKIPFHMIDIGICGEHLVLAAQAQDIASCWIGWFDAKKAQKFLKLRKNKTVCELIALGYPDSSCKPKTRKLKSIDQLITWNIGD